MQSTPVEHAGPIVGEYRDLRVIECAPCGFAHLHPLPDAGEVGARYVKGFYEDDKPGYLADTQRDAEWLSQCHRIELALIESVISKGGVLLDVGCGFGDFVAQARAAGWDAVGLEPSRYACDVLDERKLPYRQGNIETEGLATGSVDAVRLAWVLEHLADPRAVLEKLVQALKPGGVVMVIVPNDFSALQAKAALGKGDYWLHPTHVNYFTPDSLNNLLRRVGLEPAARLHTFPMEWALLGGQDYLADESIGKALHAARKKMELAQGEHETAKMWRAFAMAGIGRDMIAVARRVSTNENE